jgi:hypothetical protein
MPGRHLAQFNISRNRYPLTDARMKDFLDNVERVHQAAERIDGFVWRLHDETGHAMNIRVYDDPQILPNLTVWRDVESLERFVWQTLHKNMYKRRDEWFAPINEGAKLVIWWIPEDHHPEMAEGRERLEYLRAHGPSDHAFGWEQLSAARLWKTAQCLPEHERAA